MADNAPSWGQSRPSDFPRAPLATTLTLSTDEIGLWWGSQSAVVPRVGSAMAEASRGDGVSGVTFLTVAEVASAMRVSKMTVYRLVHAGDLPAARVGRSFRVPEDAVDEYLRKSYFQAG
jgi:excisionase family DNA binding protein